MIFLATDLDGTFLGGDSTEKENLYQLFRTAPSFRLAFVTGRGLDSVVPLFHEDAVPRPEYIICDVGATVVTGHTLEPVEPIQSRIESQWPGREHIHSALEGVAGVRPQDVPMNRRASFYYEDESVLDHLRETGSRIGYSVIISHGKYADFLPAGTDKGETLKQLVAYLNVPAEQVLVAGDTLNDLALFRAGFKGVVVGNAEEGLREATSGLAHVLQSDIPGCGGILEAMHTFGFLPGQAQP